MSIITEALTKAQEKRKTEAHQKIEAKPAEEKIIKIQAIIPDIKKETTPIREIRSAFSIKNALMLGLIVAATAAILIFMPLAHKPAATVESKSIDPPIAQARALVPFGESTPSPKPIPMSAPYRFSLTNPTLEFNLEGIISGNGAPAAIINKQVVGVGDTVKGAVVMDIKEDEVILDYNGEEITLDIK